MKKEYRGHRRASKFQNSLSSSKFPILCASWGGAFPQSKQVQKDFPLRSSLFCAEQASSKSLSSSKFPVLCTSWGLSAEQANSKRPSPSKFPILCREASSKNLSSSKLPILCASRALSAEQASSKRLSSSKFPILCRTSKFKKPFFFEVPCSVYILGPFRRANKFKKTFLFEVPYFVCIVGPFRRASKFKRTFLFEVPYPVQNKQAQEAFPLRGFLFCVHRGDLPQSKQVQKDFPFRAEQASSKGLSSSKFPTPCRTSKLKKPFLFEVPYFVCIVGTFRRANKFKKPFLFEVPYFVQNKQVQKNLSFSKFPICVPRGDLPQSKQVQKDFPLRSSLFCAEQASSKSLSSSKFPVLCASWGLSAVQTRFKKTFLFEVPYFVCLVGTFRRASKLKKAFPLRSSLQGL